MPGFSGLTSKKVQSALGEALTFGAKQEGQLAGSVPTPNLDALAGSKGGTPVVATERSAMAPTVRDLAGQPPNGAVDPLARSNMPATDRDSFIEPNSPIFSGRTPGT